MNINHKHFIKNSLSLTILVFVLVVSGCKSDKKNDAVSKSISKEIPLDSLLETLQKQTFKYFWDFEESQSGMARERSQDSAFNNQSKNIITTGGSGFGIATIAVGVERGWITREQAIERLDKILNFLESVDTFHGAFAHWYNTNTKLIQSFSDVDDGGDIVETALLVQGLLIARQYFSKDNHAETDIRKRITSIWEQVEWDWYTQGKDAITWHWSENHGFKIDLNVSGWNEALIVYVLAASSPTHGIDKDVYTNGWARNGKIRNGKTFYNYTLPLGEDYGGPLFLSQYSFIGLDPRGLKDDYVSNYFEQNKIHTLINYEYSKDNPKNYKGYGSNCWGLTASDNHLGYAAHHPNNDLGVITPSAALSAFPFTPKESEAALRYFFTDLNDTLWGPYGFYDAFSIHHDWVSNGYLAIDQGPIILMIENFRTQLLWNLFMNDTDVQKGLQKLDFSYNNGV